MGSVRRFRAVVVDSSPSVRSFVLGFGASCSRTLCTIIESAGCENRAEARLPAVRRGPRRANRRRFACPMSSPTEPVSPSAYCTSGPPKSSRRAALLWLQGCGGALFGVGHESGETPVAIERLEIGVLFDAEIGIGGQPVVNSLS